MFKFIKIFKAKSKIYNGLKNKDNNQFKKALKCFDEALEIMPECKYAFQYKGKIYEDMEIYDKALNCFDKAILQDPHFIDAWISKGRLFNSLKKHDEALNCFDRCLDLNKDNSYILANKTMVYIEKGDYESALNCADYNLKIHPEEEICFSWKAEVFRGMEDYENSIKWFKKLTEFNPSYHQGWLQLTLDYYTINKLEEAEEYLEKSIKLDKNGNHNYVHVALLKDLGKYKKALKLINRESKVGKYPYYYLLKGELLEKLNKFDESVKNYEIAIKGFKKLIKKYPKDEDLTDWKQNCENAKKRLKILKNEKMKMKEGISC